MACKYIRWRAPIERDEDAEGSDDAASDDGSIDPARLKRAASALDQARAWRGAVPGEGAVPGHPIARGSAIYDTGNSFAIIVNNPESMLAGGILGCETRAGSARLVHFEASYDQGDEKSFHRARLAAIRARVAAFLMSN